MPTIESNTVATSAPSFFEVKFIIRPSSYGEGVSEGFELDGCAKFE
jgi:hypothetical protein